MKRRALALGAVVLGLAGCGKSPAPASINAAADTPAIQPVPAANASPAMASPEDAMARFDGYGDLRFGMDEAAFRAAWQGELAGQLASGSCSYLRPRWLKQPRDLGFMFEQGHFARYDVGTAKQAAPGGGKVGMNVAQIRALYGEAVKASAHKYVEGASYLRIAAPDGRGALVFETDAGGTVTRWRVGLPPQIDYLEGCG